MKNIPQLLQNELKRRCYSWPRYDRRKRMFKHVSRIDYEAAWQTHVERWHAKHSNLTPKTRSQRIMEDLKYFAGVPYVYEGNGLDDYSKYQRPAKNGVGYVAICPGEPGNNYYVDDPVLVSILKRKYDAYWAARS